MARDNMALAVGLGGCAAGGGAGSGSQGSIGPDRVVYHVNDTRAQAVNALRNSKLTRSGFIPEATFVPSGVAEITRLPQREGYAYLRP